MKSIMKNIWNYFDGKKTKLGSLGGIITGILYITHGFFPDFIPDDLIIGMGILSGTTASVGGIHKGIKNKESIKNSAMKAIKFINQKNE